MKLYPAATIAIAIIRSNTCDRGKTGSLIGSLTLEKVLKLVERKIEYIYIYI